MHGNRILKVFADGKNAFAAFGDPWNDPDFEIIKERLKGLGARWNRFKGRWDIPIERTKTVSELRKLVGEYRFTISEKAKEILDGAFGAAEDRKAASRASDAEIGVPAPEGLSYRGFQKAGPMRRTAG